MALSIRTATGEDAAGVHTIYAPMVRDTAVSFETEAPTVDEMRRRIVTTLPDFPWLVAVDEGGRVAGYVYASRYAERAAYRWGATVTVYIHPEHRGRGVGSALYGVLFAHLREQGYCMAYAGITQPNAASVGLHESLGFTRIGVFDNAGFKHGRWHGVGWWQLVLQQPAAPAEPRPFAGGSA